MQYINFIRMNSIQQIHTYFSNLISIEDRYIITWGPIDGKPPGYTFLRLTTNGYNEGNGGYQVNFNDIENGKPTTIYMTFEANSQIRDIVLTHIGGLNNFEDEFSWFSNILAQNMHLENISVKMNIMAETIPGGSRTLSLLGGRPLIQRFPAYDIAHWVLNFEPELPPPEIVSSSVYE